MKAWGAWLPDILPHVAGCSDMLVEQEVKRAAQMFFRDSMAWRAVLDPIRVDEPEIRVFQDTSGTEIVRVEQATLGGVDLKPLSHDAVASAFGAGWATQTGRPEAITGMTPICVRLVPYPTEALKADLSLTVSLMPSDDARGIPDELYARYREAIATGGKSRLMLILGRQWTNLDMGAALAARFENEIAAARTDIARAHGRATPRSRPVYC